MPVVTTICLVDLLILLSASSVYHTTFCMPTAQRRDVSYLDQVVQSYRAQIVFRMDGIALIALTTAIVCTV